MIEISENRSNGARIKVIGVGGAGCNAVNTMIKMGLQGVEFIVANTDKQALDASMASVKIQLGHELTKGLGAGANPDVGKRAAMEDYAMLSEHLSNADMVFVTAGMGGGTGTGASPIISKIARECGALTVGVVTKPFQFEGRKRARHADQGMSDLKEQVDSLITIPNQRLLTIAGQNLSLLEAFKRADEVLLNAVQGISDLINNTGLINCDFADVRTIMQNKGLALMGTGLGRGDDRAVEAARNSITSPLLDNVRIDGATGIIVNITASSDLALHEVNEATSLIMEAAHEDAEIIFGTVIDDTLKDAVRVTVIATGLNTPAGAFSVAQPKVEQIQVEQPKTTQPEAPRIASPVMPLAEHPAKAVSITLEDLQYSKTEERASPMPAPPPSMNFGSSHQGGYDMSRAKSIAKQLGIAGFDENELDVPTFLRKTKESSISQPEQSL